MRLARWKNASTVKKMFLLKTFQAFFYISEQSTEMLQERSNKDSQVMTLSVIYIFVCATV